MADEYFDSTDRSSPHAPPQNALIFLILFALFALLFNLGGRPIESKDYLRYAEIAREILEFDDWVMLREQGNIYVDKPPLHFWLIAGSFRLLGVSPFAARLPSAMAAFCGVLITFVFARRIFRSTETAFLAAIILLAAYDYLWWARRTRVDMVFSVIFSLSLVFFYCGCETSSPKRKALWYAAFWLATGFAFVDKAFIAFANLVVVIPHSVVVTLKPEGRKISPGLLVVTSPCVLLPVLPWIIALVNHPEFSAFWEILGRTKIMDRQEAFYFYLIQMPLKLFPATPFLLTGVWGFVRYRKQLAHHRELGFALLWIVSYLFILQLTVAKSTRYLLPLYLPSALVSAWAIQFFLGKKPDVFRIVIGWGDRLFMVVAVLGMVIPFVVAYHYNVGLLPPLLYTACMCVALALTRKFLPLRTAGLFVSFTILLLAIDVGDTVGREKASVYYRMGQILKKEKLAPAEITFHPCFSRAQTAMGFYFNQLMQCSDSWAEIAADPKISAIVTTRKALETEIPKKDIANRGRIIPCDKGYVVFIRQN